MFCYIQIVFVHLKYIFAIEKEHIAIIFLKFKRNESENFDLVVVLSFPLHAKNHRAYPNVLHTKQIAVHFTFLV